MEQGFFRNYKKLVLPVFFLLIGLLAYTLVEPHRLEVKEVDVVDMDIPTEFNGFTIAFMTDIHHGPFFSDKRVRALVKRVNELNPDIILLGGDYIHRDAKFIEPCFAELAFLKADYGKFGVLGNHDHWEDGGRVKECMKNAEITPLDNQAEWIHKNNERIKIGGVGDMWTDTQDIAPTINDVSVEDFVILLSHNPDYAETITTDKIDLVLSGHTHGGQVTFFGLWAPLI
ncbi:MAG TPA: metallophosphoesterase, partial [Clostridia bacterium]|nr:metallophosphoesterase [Clostridia bacterium]